MKLLILLLSICLDKWAVRLSSWRRFDGLLLIYRQIARLPLEPGVAWQAAVRLVLWLVVPLLLLAAFLMTVGKAVFGLVGLELAVILLWYSLKPLSIAEELQQCHQADEASVLEMAKPLLTEQAPSADDLSRQLTLGVLWQYYDRFFAVVFWFCLLGPVAAITYRVLAECHQAQYLEGKEHCWLQGAYRLVSWLPTRATALSYALMGDFTVGFGQLQQTLRDWDSRTVLLTCGLSALRSTEDSADEQENSEALALGYRAAVLWVVLLALSVIVSIVL